MRRSLLAVLGVVGGAVVSSPGDAQPPRYGASVGLAMPAGAYDVTRGPGPLVRGTITWGAPRRHVYLRGEIEGATMLASGQRAPNGMSSAYGNLHVVSALLSYIVGGRSERFAPYVYVGAGLQHLRVRRGENPYGTTVGGRAGVGARGTIRGKLLHVEIARHTALTGFATGEDFTLGSYIPVMFGITF